MPGVDRADDTVPHQIRDTSARNDSLCLPLLPTNRLGKSDNQIEARSLGVLLSLCDDDTALSRQLKGPSASVSLSESPPGTCDQSAF